MNRIFPMLLLVACVTSLFLTSCNNRSEAPRILVFSKNTYYFHESIPAGVEAIMKLGKENNFVVDTTTDAAYFTEDTLKKYSAVVFLNNADNKGELLNNYQEADFERYIQAGGGYVGIHAASDAEYNWGWYVRLVGGTFNGHPENQNATLEVIDNKHISTKHLQKEWKRFDEWYNFRNLNPDVKVLLKIDEKSYKGGINGDNHPMSWYHEYDGGRAWFTALGHTIESYSEPDFLKHLLGGIKYAIGKNKKLNYNKVKTERTPEEERFTKTSLVQGTFTEPTEMTILPNLDILVAQRRGEILYYKQGADTIKQVGFLNVYWKTVNTPNVNAEEGLMGMQKDPDFEKNHYVYLYYSPADTSVNRLSRFTFENDTLTSEKVVLELYSQREICCHTGGSITFGKDRIMYLSTGDNSTPFDEEGEPYANHGFGPMDDRPGHEQYDARRSSSNTNDLRGKILRIRVNEDGTYTIPDGNLFPKGKEKTRPEIYVMGTRNPYRISVDQKSGFLYWGEVGPDANVDSVGTRGPRGYDELNQARQAGYFGWPLFVGNNYPYHDHDYETNKNGPLYDPAKPINKSRNNTGLQELPPVSPAFIWYPYADSPDFPEVGSGGRNAMAGPVYYTDMFPKETRLPDYFNGKLFIYDWIRGWIKLVTMRENGDFDKMEPFMPNTKFNALIDFEVGPDGQLYGLEYGNGWFSQNPDAGLFRIDYNRGNMAPKFENLTADKMSGTLPLKVKLTAEAKDPENGKLTYVWNINNEQDITTTEPFLEHTFSEVGEYLVSVQVKDDKDGVAKSPILMIAAGNEAPVVNIQIMGNKTFYFPQQPIQYAVSVNDKDDPMAAKNLSSVVVTADYIEGYDKAAISQGHQVLSQAAMGKNLMLSLDCKVCHKEAEKSVGPSYLAIAQRYEKDKNAVPYLTKKIIKGGGGVWGEVAMAAHPDLSEQDAQQIVAWIQSLAATSKKTKSLPVAGKLPATLGKPAKDNGALILNATYTDQGGNGIGPLTGNSTVVLRSSKLNFGNLEKEQMKGFSTVEFNGMAYLTTPSNGGWVQLDSADLSGIRQVAAAVAWQAFPVSSSTFELRLDSPDGKKIGETVFTADPNAKKIPSGLAYTQPLTMKIKTVTDGKWHRLYLVSKPNGGNGNGSVTLGFLQLSL